MIILADLSLSVSPKIKIATPASQQEKLLNFWKSMYAN
jgi:hypothetical protein